MTKKEDTEFIRVLFTSILGKTHSIELTYERLDELYDDGICFDGSSVPGYAEVNSSDLLLKPIVKEPLSASWDSSMVIVPCRVHDTSGKPHMCDPISILEKVTTIARRSGFELVAGFELEFFLVNAKGDCISPADEGGYFSTQPADRGQVIRRESIRALHAMGIPTTTHHHEVAKGQHEIGLKHEKAESAALSLMLAKHVISEVAFKNGLVATFMPKPFSGMNGSGMHIHQSLWTDDLRTNAFSSGIPSKISSIGESYIAGILEHAKALSAIVAPTVNSFKRLVPGFEAPTRIAWGPKNRTTMLRIPHFNGSERTARVEFRCPDPSCSPHLALASVLSAGIDGVRRELKPPTPTTEDLFHEESLVSTLPKSLEEALDELAKAALLHTMLGDRAVREYLELKEDEWLRFSNHSSSSDKSQVTSWEVKEYLEAA